MGIHSRLSESVRTFSAGEPAIIECIISADILRQAQLHPEDYKGLVIMVAGYSAFFTELPRELQDTIIERTEHCG